jgi:hypothetical protein
VAERRLGHVPVRKGEEIMAFHLGSTIVLLVAADLRLADGVEPGRDVRLGTDIAFRTS